MMIILARKSGESPLPYYKIGAKLGSYNRPSPLTSALFFLEPLNSAKWGMHYLPGGTVENHKKIWLRIASLWADIWIWDLLNVKECWPLSCDVKYLCYYNYLSYCGYLRNRQRLRQMGHQWYHSHRSNSGEHPDFLTCFFCAEEHKN
jgi:hypothetical protein